MLKRKSRVEENVSVDTECKVPEWLDAGSRLRDHSLIKFIKVKVKPTHIDRYLLNWNDHRLKTFVRPIPESSPSREE
jgi:hypothetical protein